MSDTGPLLTTTQAATKLGCHPETLRRAIRKGTLTCFRFGGCIRLSAAHLQAYLAGTGQPAKGAKG